MFVGHTGQRSGAEAVMLSLIDLALAQGYRVTLACPDGPLVDALPETCGHMRIPALGMSGQTGIRRALGLAALPVRWLVAGMKIRRVHEAQVVCNSLFALPAVRVAVGGTSRRKTTTWLVHDTMSTPKQRFVARLGRPAVSRAVAVSEASARPVRKAGFRVVVVPNGVTIPSEVHRPTGTSRVGILASVTEWKGHRVLLDALALLPDAHLDVAGAPFPGDEGFLEELRCRADRPDVRGRVSFLGRVDPKEAFRTWDVLVSASISPEAGPLGVLEAMAHGVPVVGTDHGGTADYLADGAGLLVPPGDAAALAAAIRRVLDDSVLRRNVVETALRKVRERHDIDVTLPVMGSALWGGETTAASR